MSFRNEPSAFMKMMKNDMQMIAMRQYGQHVQTSSSFTYQSAYYTALCNTSQGYGSGYGGGYSTASYRPNTGTYNNASWSSDYLV